MGKLAVMLGLGQLGRVFAGGLLKTGHVVVPVNRGDDLETLAARWPEPDLVMVSVAEADLHPVLSALPDAWRDNVGLLQNELLPRDWQAHGIESPTVISVWFEKKPGKDAQALLSSPVYGPHAESLVDALAAIDLPAHALPDEAALLRELVRKNLYILTTNIAGMESGGDVAHLRDRHHDLMRAVASDVLDVQGWLTGQSFDRDALLTGMLEAFAADPAHGCAGRSAASRLKRALHHADAAGLATPELHRIAAAHGIV
jgi:ketopantoate reductase